MKNHQLSLPIVSVQICLFLTLLFIPFFSFAQLGKYEFTGTSTADNQFNEVTVQPPHAVFSPFSRVGVHYYKAAGVFNSRNWQSPTNPKIGFIEFTITAKPGYTLHLTHLEFDSYRTEEGPSKIKIAHNASGRFNTDSLQFIPGSSSNGLKTTSWNFADFTTAPGGAVTFRIYGLEASNWLGNYRIDNFALYGVTIPQLNINELHYANTATTKTGFVEVTAPKDFTELNTATLTLYNNAGKMYDTYSLNNFKSLLNSVYGDRKIYYLDIPKGLVDGNGGISLSMSDHLIQFVSYGGAIKAIDGPAINKISQDLGVTETAADGAYHSLALMPQINKSLTSTSGPSNGPIVKWEKTSVDNNTKGYDNSEPYQVLPVELMYFQAKATAEGVLLNWATASEINNKEFTIEKSAYENLEFKGIKKIDGHGTTQQQQKYQFLDPSPYSGTSYYRLKQTDLDGTVTYSKVVAVARKEITTPLALYPNPALAYINVTIDKPASNEGIMVQIIDLKGLVMYQQVHKYFNKSNNLNISIADLPAGNYYLVIMKDGKREAKPFLKNN